MSEFAQFFQQATGYAPYPFQVRFATDGEIPHLVRAPTGAGKTATAVLGWLWRWKSRPHHTPRRLVYCLPMRVLVEQSTSEAEKWIRALGMDIKVHILMGGVDKSEWYLHPEKHAVLIGTQDMLLSRALNRGYAASRFHWPIDFGLLNNDCLWVFDEPQLMANGVSTSAQLAGFRQILRTAGKCQSVWMSATLEPTWLDTVDFAGKFDAPSLELRQEDYVGPLNVRMTADKTLKKLAATASKDGKAVAKDVLAQHQDNTQTLVVLNTVDRAKAVYDDLDKLRKKKSPPELLLVHSRFRPAERVKLNEALQSKTPGDRIIVATQVVEAGVDITSRTMVTELAPWASIVQRIGRCNRTGHDGPGRVFWVDVADEKLAPPYEWSDLNFAREYLLKLEDQSVSPKALDDFKQSENITLPFEHTHVVRRRDLLDLFDTAPDLSGNDIDVSRFVRSDDPETDVQVFWRAIPETGPTPDEPSPHRLELCNVPVGQAAAFLKDLADKNRGSGYVWDHIDEQWRELDPKQVRPGLVILLPSTAGGYSSLGWDPSSASPVPIVALPEKPQRESGIGSDPNSAMKLPNPLTISQHTSNVCNELNVLLKELEPLVEMWAADLRTAALWHDVGKGHAAFQIGVRSVNPGLDPGTLWAKSGMEGRMKHGRKQFRHELASALAVLQMKLPFPAAYLVAAHHGRPRLGIRSVPEEEAPPDPDQPFALGVWHDDPLPAVDLGEATWPGGNLDLTPMRLSGPDSWTARALVLLADLGPFRLAYLEAILRAADVRASRKEAGRE
ncbi:MAG: CRISPR-associated helicase Cas3' [Planctomycetaceae bacterium]|nr:CRISPR-associated helicase Cas3' [Planctomycetaceae bacterium]